MQETPGTITIIIADDHPFFRGGLRQALTFHKQISVIAEASNGKELCSLVQKLTPDVVITDITMPEMNGIEATLWIKEHYPKTGIIALSMYDEATIIREIISAGIYAYLLKTADIVDVADAVHAASRGRYYFSTATAHHINSILQNKPKSCQLTKREIEIIQLLFEEHTSKEISAELHLSERTVEDHRKNIQQKIGTKNVVGLIKYALINKIVKLKDNEQKQSIESLTKGH